MQRLCLLQLQGPIQNFPKGGVETHDTKSRVCVCAGGGVVGGVTVCTVRFRSDTKSGGGGGGGGGGCLEEEGEVPYMKGGVATPNPPPTPVSTSVQDIHENDLEWYVTLVVYTHASYNPVLWRLLPVSSKVMTNPFTPLISDGITYTMPVLYGHNGAVDNTQTPKIYAFNTLEILYTQLSV